ncbi:hypothetical protein DMUE_3043 [Dictyocoela muelleri]|nr:hypothetical protein DMUE_3043 [Dictyocoela muelleri]
MKQYFEKDNIHFYIPSNSYILTIELSEFEENKRNYIFDEKCPIYDDLSNQSPFLKNFKNEKIENNKSELKVNDNHEKYNCNENFNINCKKLKIYETQQRIFVDIETPFAQKTTPFPKRLILIIILSLIITDKKVNFRIISFVDNIDFNSFMDNFNNFMKILGFCNDGDLRIDEKRVFYKDVVVCDSNF